MRVAEADKEVIATLRALLAEARPVIEAYIQDLYDASATVRDERDLLAKIDAALGGSDVVR